MTLDEIRDEIAEKLGCTRGKGPVAYWSREGDKDISHPVPASLDWVAEQWPKERNLTISRSRNTGLWSATSDGRFAINHPTELHARLALLLAVLEAEGTR